MDEGALLRKATLPGLRRLHIQPEARRLQSAPSPSRLSSFLALAPLAAPHSKAQLQSATKLPFRISRAFRLDLQAF